MIGTPTTLASFRTTKRFPELDGLRAVAVILVVAAHSRDPLIATAQGTGVPLFFVTSGFLITLLLVREERQNGTIDLGAFYARRALRLFPVYYLALALALGLAALGLAEDRGDWARRVVMFSTFLNEFAGPGTFEHTWSLAVQEKYYLVWPVLAFILPFTRHRRVPLTCLVIGLLTIGWLLRPSNPTEVYLPILIGCLLALGVEHPRGWPVLGWLGRPVVFVAVLVGIVVVRWFDHTHGQVSLPFSAAVALLLPGVLVGPDLVRRALRSRAMRFVGIRAYAVFVFHPFVFHAVGLVLHENGPVLEQLARYVVTVLLSVGIASITFRWVEQPAIAWGRRITRRRAERRGDGTALAAGIP